MKATPGPPPGLPAGTAPAKHARGASSTPPPATRTLLERIVEQPVGPQGGTGSAAASSGGAPSQVRPH
eukprot:5205224-Alexandrium_andersonii.AAC.1